MNIKYMVFEDGGGGKGCACADVEVIIKFLSDRPNPLGIENLNKIKEWCSYAKVGQILNIPIGSIVVVKAEKSTEIEDVKTYLLSDQVVDMIDRIKTMARRTYDVIGPDLPSRMTQDEVIETVGDADYMLAHGRDKEAYQFWNRLDYRTQNNLLLLAFPAKEYHA